MPQSSQFLLMVFLFHSWVVYDFVLPSSCFISSHSLRDSPWQALGLVHGLDPEEPHIAATGGVAVVNRLR
jgi:hypothetical protein